MPTLCGLRRRGYTPASIREFHERNGVSKVNSKVEASLATCKPEDRFQFLRLGYFCADNKDCTPDHLVFNKAVGLKDSYKPQ